MQLGCLNRGREAIHNYKEKQIFCSEKTFSVDQNST